MILNLDSSRTRTLTKKIKMMKKQTLFFILMILLSTSVISQDRIKTITYHNESTYVGELKNGVPHGQGTLRYKTGSEYKGAWKNGNRHGQMTSTYKNFKKIGIWENNFKYNVSCYKDGELSGKYIEGKYYKKSELSHNILNRGDQKTITYPDGSKYVGEIKNGKRHGKGNYLFASGDRYVGEWYNNNITGKGIFLFRYGDKYEGEFLKGKFHGDGGYTDQNGDNRGGTWKNHILYKGRGHNDQGVVGTFLNGNFYEEESEYERRRREAYAAAGRTRKASFTLEEKIVIAACAMGVVQEIVASPSSSSSSSSSTTSSNNQSYDTPTSGYTIIEDNRYKSLGGYQTGRVKVQCNSNGITYDIGYDGSKSKPWDPGLTYSNTATLKDAMNSLACY